MEKKQYLAGAHVSIAGGFFKAIEAGKNIGCTVIQIFTKSNRQWSSKAILEEDAKLFITTQKNSAIQVVIAHASYLINLGSIDQKTEQASYYGLINEIKRCSQLKIPYLVLHPGTAEAQIKKQTLKNISKKINQILTKTSDCNVTVLIETMAGQGKSIGCSFEELASILEFIEDKTRIGICFDTCHVFAAGYDFTTQEKYTKVFEDFDKKIGLSYLKLFHMNDSKKELGCNVDRHENIGEGKISIQAFAMIMNDERFVKIPKIIETPKSDNLENDKKNLETLVSLLK